MHFFLIIIPFTSNFIPTHYLNPSVFQQSTNGQNCEEQQHTCKKQHISTIISRLHLTPHHTTKQKITHLHHDGRIIAPAASPIHPQTHLPPRLAPETRPHRAMLLRSHCPAATPLPVQFLPGQWLAVSCEQGECHNITHV